MRVGREFQTTIDSSEGEEDDGEGGRESLHGGEMQQASSTAMDDGETKGNSPLLFESCKQCHSIG